MLNYFNFKKLGTDFLITNDFGMFTFLKTKEFQKLISNKLTPADSCYQTLVDNCFIINKPHEIFVNEMSGHLRTLKSYAFSATALHIFAVTNSCNMNCIYCQAKDVGSTLDGKMTITTGKKAIDLTMQSPSDFLTFEFQGGEPLLNFEVIKEMITYSKSINKTKTIEYTIVTNLIALTDEILEYLISENISICTSLDGCKEVHNYNRKLKNGGDTFDIVKNNIEKIRRKGKQLGGIETTTRHSLKYPKEIVDEYIDRGITSIFLRPLTPLGFAKSYWEKVGYTPEEYLNFYKEAFDYIIDLNLKGIRFPEIHSTYFLKKMINGTSDNYMELRSPCGASIGQMSYYHDGNVYTCDEGRMISETGDFTFKLGNVYENTYDQFMNSSVCKTTCAASVVESLPTCCDCAYHPYCGVCPVVSYAENKDIFSKSPHDYRCKIYSGMLDILFDILHSQDEEKINVLYDWIRE